MTSLNRGVFAKTKRDLKLYCFSPPVMLATFLIEIGLAVFTVWRYKLTSVTRVAIALLMSLAVFQLAEFNVCEGIGLDPLLSSRIGYIAITLLPPLGIHLAYEISGSRQRNLLWPAYASAAVFSGFFLLVGQSLTGHACMGNYVIFQMAPGSVWVYALYYYGWMIVGTWLAWFLANQQKTAGRRALYGLMLGYLVFIVPTTTVNIISPATIEGIPSIMCGFAVLLAIILVTWVLPHAHQRIRK